MVLGQVAVQIAIAGNGDADGRRNQPVRLSGGRFRHHDEGHLPRFEALGSLRAGQNAALGRKDARNPHQIARGDAGGAKRQLE